MNVFETAVEQLAEELESRGCKTKVVGTDLYLVDNDEMRKLDVQSGQVTCVKTVPDKYGIQLMALDVLIELEKNKSQ